jgi:GMP synthase (glutamine-hydrolysing)
MRLHFVVHEAFEAPGAFETWARHRGYSMGYSRVYAGDRLPAAVNDIDLLILLGGPQSPATPRSECPHFDADAEKALIARAISANRAVIGVCLGSQLIGEALGAKHEASPEKEIGKFPITLTEEGIKNEKVAHFGKTLSVGHWHNDMPGLTAGAKVLAYSEGCPRQIVEYNPLVYGFQCHMEFTREVIALLIAASGNKLAGMTRHRFVQQPDALHQNDYSEMNEKLFVFLDKLVGAYRVESAPLRGDAP